MAVQTTGGMMKPLRQLCSQLCKEYAGVFAGLLGLQLITYTYFFTSLIFTDHTFPNSGIYPYPSFKTVGEGRWLADFIIRLASVSSSSCGRIGSPGTIAMPSISSTISTIS